MGALFHDGAIYEFHRSPSVKEWTWRRAQIESYITAQPAWDTLATWKEPEGGSPVSDPSAVCQRQRCLVRLPGAAPADVVWREFDLEDRHFMESGFVLPGQRFSRLIWQDVNTLIIKRESTASNTADQEAVLFWSRGQALTDAKVLLRADDPEESLGVEAFVDIDRRPLVILSRRSAKDQRSRMRELHVGERAAFPLERQHWRVAETGELRSLAVPADAQIVGFHAGQIILLRGTYGDRSYSEKNAWKPAGDLWKEGVILSVLLAESSDAAPQVTLVAPRYPGQATHQGGARVFTTRDCLVVRTFEYLRLRYRCYRFTSGRWVGSEIRAPVEFSWLSQPVLSDPTSSLALTSHQSMIQPKSLFAIDTEKGRAIELPGRALLPFSDPAKYVMRRLEATSRDGTKVPYFVAYAKDIDLNGRNPALVWVFGGHGAPELPAYDRYCRVGAWMERGGVCVVANIRGGTEMGGDWYVRKTERRHVYDDVIAVGEDLVRRRLTSPKRLGVLGHSWYGGLAAAVVARMRPDLFNAAVLEHGILDVFDPVIRDDFERASGQHISSPEPEEERPILADPDLQCWIQSGHRQHDGTVCLGSDVSRNPFLSLRSALWPDGRRIVKHGNIYIPCAALNVSGRMT